ncbi:MAG TPA: chemotaxis protein CheA [Nitrospirota bacterium]|nr:chemotaxis protein CheA [Nitrospirota bacterium]
MADEMLDEMQELIRDFIVETDEVLEGLDQCFVKLEEVPGDLGLINEIFRAVHSIKGSAGFLGFTRLVDVAHQSENVLNKLRQQEIQASSETIDIILESVDVLKVLMTEIKDSTGEQVDINTIKRKLALLLEYSALLETSSSGSDVPDQTSVSSGLTKDDEKISLTPPFTKEEVRIPPLEKGGKGGFEGLSSSQTAEEPVNINNAVVNEPTVNESPDKNSVKQASGASDDKEQTLRIDTNRLDHVMDLVGELVLSRNRLSKILSDIEGLYEGDEKIKTLLETSSNLSLITTELQLSVMKMRMVPIRKVFNKFPRMVRDIARKANKKINLEMHGESTEIDKSVIEELNDPLVHIIRNSIDHGIETPEERLKNGKPEAGTIKLNAYQEGNSIVIQIEDDGKGIDPVVIEKKARERGLIRNNDIKLSPKEILNYIFEPGFSTAEKVTDISGRGVGMDVVKTNIGRINGIIDVNSNKGNGTQVFLKIPLTLAIIQVLMVKVNGEMYALPLASILETFRVSRSSLKYIDGQQVLNVRNRLIPLIKLSEVLDLNCSEMTEDWVYVVLMAIAEKKVGVIVDELCHQEEVVIKPVGTYFSDIKEVSGATITGDGKVGLILDPGSLIYRQRDLITA